MKRIAIWDLDGTVIDSLHRYRTRIDDAGVERIDLEYWRANEHRAMQDSLLPLHAEYLRDLADRDCFVVVATARVVNRPDARFITERLGMPDYIISRKPDDSQSGKTLKANGLARLFNLKQFRDRPATFWEDNSEYLSAVCSRFPQVTGILVESKQSH